MEVWQGWNQWVGAPSCMFSGNAVIDPQPYFVGTVWASDVRWTGSHQTPYLIRGRALDGNGAPLAGASVELWAVYNPPSPGGLTPGVYPSMPGGSPKILIAMTTTDALGNYAFGVADNTTKYRVIVDTGAAIGGTAPTVVGS
jgi:protocatechuate 3,4-dioxygenase beta subunit